MNDRALAIVMIMAVSALMMAPVIVRNAEASEEGLEDNGIQREVIDDLGDLTGRMLVSIYLQEGQVDVIMDDEGIDERRSL